MARNIVVTTTTAETSDPVPLNPHIAPFNVALYTKVVGTSVSDVQYSPDDPWTFTSAAHYNASGSWYTLSTLSGVSADDDGNIDFPVRAVRLDTTSHTSGSVTLTVIQAGIAGN